MSSQRSARKSDGSQRGVVSPRTPLPFGWYVFFGIVEPISVLAGCVYAIVFQDNYYSELVPAGYLRRVSLHGLRGGAKQAAANAVTSALPATGATRMALAQLGSCYFLIMLNSALMFYAIRRWFGQMPVAQERVLYFLFTVLGLADWTHILLTIYFLPPTTSTNATASASLVAASTDFARKVWLLSTDASVWNSLLFGNIIITFLLFCARAAWWVGIGRDRFFGGSVPDVPTTDKKAR